LLRARQLGWQVEGMDFDPKAVEQARARGLDVRSGSIEDYTAFSEQFDVITCNHVVEHVYQPYDLIYAIHRLLKPGGLLWIETPNIDSEGHAHFGAWRGLEAPRHIAIFSHKALVELLHQVSFVITHQTPFNIQHIRQVFAGSEAILSRDDPHATVTPLLPNRRLASALLSEMFFFKRREFICLRAIKATH